jgi:hypothetical protein
MSPKDFVALKRPKTSAERIACLGFYLSECRGLHHFKTADIVSLNTEAAQSRMGNPARDMDNAERSSGYLASAGHGSKQISARGEALVRALPDREAAAAALKDHPVRRRKATAKKATDTDGSSSTTSRKKSRKASTPAATVTDQLPTP